LFKEDFTCDKIIRFSPSELQAHLILEPKKKQMNKPIQEQIGESYSFDFEKNEWTFKMPDGFICSAGKFKITPILNNQKPNE